MDKIVVKIGDTEYDTGSVISGPLPDPSQPEDWHIIGAIALWVCGNAFDPEKAREILRDAV